MPVLHIVNKSPYERNALDACLRLAKADSSILLIEDGVYAAMRGAAAADRLGGALEAHRVYVLQPDLQARGLDAGRLLDGVETVDYDGFVKLATEHDKLQSWL